MFLAIFIFIISYPEYKLSISWEKYGTLKEIIIKKLAKDDDLIGNIHPCEYIEKHESSLLRLLP